MSRVRLDKYSRSRSALSVAALISIFLGIFLQVGPYYYTSNVVLKLIGLVVPVSIASMLFWKSNHSFTFTLTKFQSIWLIAALMYSFFTVLSAQNVGQALFGSGDRNLGLLTFAVYILFFFVGTTIANQKSEELLRWGLVVLASSQSFIVFFQKFLKPDNLDRGGKPEAPGVWGTFYNANPLSFFLGMISSAFLAYLFFQRVKSNLSRLVLLSTLFSIFLGMYLSGSSQGLIGFFVVSLIYLAKRFSIVVLNNFNSLLQFTAVMALMLFIFTIQFFKISDISRVSSNPYLERLEIYKSSIKMFLLNPLFGVGVDDFQSRYGQVTSLTDLKLVDNAHSIPLQILATQGLLGFSFYLSMFVLVLGLKRSQNSSTQAVWGFWQALFFSYLVIGIIGIDHPVIGSVAYLSAGILHGKSVRSKNSHESRTFGNINRFFGLPLPILATLLSLTIVFSFIPELRSSVAVYHLSSRGINPQEFRVEVERDYADVHNARLLLVLGQAMVATDDRNGANLVAERMLSSFPNDQRTSVLLFAIAEKWNDEDSLKTAVKIRNHLFPKSTTQ